LVFDDSRAAVSIASNCRWVRPRVGDSAGTVGDAHIRLANGPGRRQ
jgi:hypothetical protein